MHCLCLFPGLSNCLLNRKCPYLLSSADFLECLSFIFIVTAISTVVFQRLKKAIVNLFIMLLPLMAGMDR